KPAAILLKALLVISLWASIAPCTGLMAGAHSSKTLRQPPGQHGKAITLVLGHASVSGSREIGIGLNDGMHHAGLYGIAV
ncbi:hypothetical protein, partial [Enterococcus faecalis]|uniref:hypothetical protein n=1 Tax=Enterococcus faecalis TaxID=1351 RepID=UPI00403F6898